MPDLHGWITQQIDAAEEHALDHQLNPTAALRRCAADRKILDIHQPQGGGWPDHYACDGCGYTGSYCPGPITEHVNDCPTLLALAEGYGLTDEQRTQLDRPQPEPPKRTGPSLIPDSLAEAMGKSLLAAMTTQAMAAPTPGQKAMDILAPELKKISTYVPIPK